VRVEVSLRAVLCPKRGSLLEGHLGAGGFAVLRQEAPCVDLAGHERGACSSVRALLAIRGECVSQKGPCWPLEGSVFLSEGVSLRAASQEGELTLGGPR